ncbi:MAG: HEAT repeat domain-containing protein [Planctomycetota bacterium]
MMTRILILAVMAAVLAGCDSPYTRERPVAGACITCAPKELANLSESDFLMRKATLGSRTERMEAIDVIARTNDPSLFTFLLERLKVDDDRFIQIRIMHALSDAADVRAVPVLRRIARWDDTRVGIEAIEALYDLGDDSLMLKLIDMLRPNENYPEIPSVAYRSLCRMTGASIPPTRRAWLVYYQTRRLAPYETKAWYWPFQQPPLPKTAENSTKIEQPLLRGKPQLPDQDVRVRRKTVQFSDFWKNEAP